MVDWAADVQSWPIAHVGVNHGRGDVLVSEQLLDRANIVAALQQMGRKAVAERVTAGRFTDPGITNRLFDGILQIFLPNVVSAFLTTAGINGRFISREDVLPSPFARGIRIFAMER